MSLTPTSKLQSYANMHWPGLYSIALGESRLGGLSRLYLAPPGMLHPELSDWHAPFLHHAHSYDFVSFTLVGAVENFVYRTAYERGEPFYAYHFRPASEGGPELQYRGTDSLKLRYHEVARAGERYELECNDVHRVLFHADRATGWFAVRIEEGPPQTRPELCYGRHYLQQLPHVDEDLYHPVTATHASELLGMFVSATGVTP